MQELKLSNKQTIKVTLNKAHKILSTLQKYASKKRSDLEFEVSKYMDDESPELFEMAFADIVSKTESELKSSITSQIQQRVGKYISAIEVLEDLRDIKEQVFEANISSGISKKLSYIEKKKHILELYEKLFSVESDRSDIDSIASRFERLKQSDLEVKENIVYSFVYWDKESIKEELKTIRSTMLKYEEEIQILNSTTKIELSLYKSSAEILGL